MKQLINATSFLLLSMVLVFTSCQKEDDLPPPDKNVVSGTITIDASAYDKWVYFSFAEEKIVQIDDFSTSMDWDMGFHRFDVRVNCGASGPGQGGTLNKGKIDFDALIEAPESGYSLNDSIDIIEELGNWVFTTVPGDTLLAKWIIFSGPPPTYTITDNIFVVKTAHGKYSKIWLKDFYNDNSETGFVTMRYVYQPDGSRKLE